MLADFLSVFRRLFTTRRSRTMVAALVVTAAVLPVSEILVLRIFSALVLEGPDLMDDGTAHVMLQVGLLLLVFAVTRCVHHAVRLGRVRVFRGAFDQSGHTRTASQESWEWALALELSMVLVSLIQVLVFSAVFFVFDWPVGLLNAVLSGVVIAIVSLLYRRQLTAQLTYARTGAGPGTVAIAERVGGRIKDAELGAILASAAMACVLAALVVRALLGEIGGADAVVLFIGLRLLSSQLGLLSASAMRFSRALARRGGE